MFSYPKTAMERMMKIQEVAVPWKTQAFTLKPPVRVNELAMLRQRSHSFTLHSEGNE